jgi:transposase-like protein
MVRSSIWLYARFALSLRDVEEMFAERRLDVWSCPGLVDT